MRNFKIINYTMAVLLWGAASMVSCSKDDPSSAAVQIKSTKCTACDSLRNLLSRNPEMNEIYNRFDSIYSCDSSGWRPMCTSNPDRISTNGSFRDYYNNIKLVVIHGLSYFSSNIPNISHEKIYSHTYYSLKLTADTPYVCPHFLSFNYEETISNTKVLPCRFRFNPPYWDSQAQLVNTQKNSNMVEHIVQKRDTLYILPHNLSKVYLTVNGETKTFWLKYLGVLSPDREAMTLTLSYYCTHAEMLAKKPCKVIENYIMKRYR